MFKFGFSHDSDDDNVQENNKSNNHIKWLESSEIDPNEVKLSVDLSFNTISRVNYQIKHLCIDNVVRALENNEYTSSVITAEQNHSDLITAKYEGGLKVWECTYDLLNFIDDNNLDFTHKNVLDLGCGAGIIGIASCLKGGHTVFQDYNSEVITSITIPNVSLNDIKYDKCEFYCGDWGTFSNLLQNKSKIEKFDFIFTSETIYNPDNYEKLIDIFSNLLKPSGIIYLAAKYYYFGVGGGIGQFKDLLQKNKKFSYSTAWECNDGVKRAIIKITLK